mmetsp:Transcript_11694/g.16709  ORF Transcript_11694/g.16709 Transcript_11694/m.16709 type:complete len:492 (-) Transcript_11694:92-1567(-)
MLGRTSRSSKTKEEEEAAEELQPMKTATAATAAAAARRREGSLLSSLCYCFSSSSSSSEKQFLILSYPQLICICFGAVLLGIGLSVEYHTHNNNDNHSLRAPPSFTPNAPPSSLVTEANTLLEEDSTGEFDVQAKAVNDKISNSSKSKNSTKNGTSNHHHDDDNKKKHSKKDDMPGLKLVWLMSFPNSGTSFTGKALKEYSKRSTATNYGNGNVDDNQNSVSVYPDHPESGPFWVDPHGKRLQEYPMPKEYVLTKTHCGGRCEYCAPDRYIENIHSFEYQCLQGKRRYHDKEGKNHEESTLYDINRVRKAIHLIRNPFDNIVSRYHLEVHEYHKKKDSLDNITEYDGSRAGFREFCSDLDGKFGKLEKGNRVWDEDILKIVKGVPCHADFFRYIQWHNMAAILLKELDIPTYVLHYEKYDTDFDKTLEEMMEFIEQKPRGPKVKFIKGKEYSEFFHQKERIAIKKAAKEMALASTWELIKHYFDDIPDHAK